MLGDAVKQGLELVGVTEDRVRAWLGDCCCEERREKLNQLDAACRRIVRGRIEWGRNYLAELLEQRDDDRRTEKTVGGCPEEVPGVREAGTSAQDLRPEGMWSGRT